MEEKRVIGRDDGIRRRRRKEGGFTAIEMMIVIAAIIIILAGIVAALKIVRDRAKVTGTIEDIHSFKTAYAAFESDTGYYPQDGDITVLYDSSRFASYGGDPDTWRGPYLPPPKGDVTIKPRNRFGGEYDAVYQDIDGDGYMDYGVVIKNVPIKFAEDIDVKIDGKADGTAGRVRYNGNSGRVDVIVIFGSE